jgi:O-antigen/teichoic acid export membrane protein
MSRLKVLKSTSLISASQIIVYGCGFVKNVILFRYLSKTDFGIAASFNLTMLMFEFVSKMAVDRLIVQAKEGDDPCFQKTAHLVQFWAGFLGSILTYACAEPLTRLFDIPESLYAFQWMALIPLMRGLAHLDISRMQREMRFGPQVTIEVVPQLIVTAATLPLTLWLVDYRAPLVLVLAKTAMTIVGTHLATRHPYRWGWNPVYVRRIVAFSWPLMINGLLLFAIRQGDQFAVGAGYSMADLAGYNVAVSLSVEPGMMFVTVLSSIMLPLLSRNQSEPQIFHERFTLALQTLSLASSFFMAVVTLAGPFFLVLVYGAKASTSHVYILWLSAGQALLFLRMAPTLASMAKANTSNLMISNFFRLSGVGLAVLVTLNGGKLYLIAVAALLGEALALAASLVCLARIQKGVLQDLRLPIVLFTGTVLLVGLLTYAGVPTMGWPTVLAVTSVVVVLNLGCGWGMFPVFRNEALEIARHFGGEMRARFASNRELPERESQE